MITLEEVTEILHKHKDEWLLGTHQGNDGNQGNTLEGLLGVVENNLRLPDLGDIELKTQKAESGSFITLFHKEPLPRASIPKLLKCLGWRHTEAGLKYKNDEMSFRSTTYAHRYSSRGFTIDLTDQKINFVFSPANVSALDRDLTSAFRTYGDWLADVEKRVPHYSSVLPVYWNRSDFEEYCITKLDSTLFCLLQTKKTNGKDYYKIEEAYIHKGFLRHNLQNLFADGSVVIDFDARTRHNHGTKLRIKKSHLHKIFEFSKKLL